MQRKKTFFIGAMAALISLTNAYAEVPAHEEAGRFEARSASGDYRLGIGGLLRTGVEVLHVRPDTTGFDFFLDKARIRLYGNAFDPALTYLFQMYFDFASGSGSPEGPAKLLDFSVNGVVHEYLQIATGKFAVPFARQQVMPAYKAQFLKDNILDSEFGIGTRFNRDVGVILHNGYNRTLEYALALVRSGIRARVAYNHGDIDAYDPVDWRGGNLRFGVGASGFVQTDWKTKFNDKLGAIDFILKVEHFASNGALYLKNDAAGTNWGAGIDAGYLINYKWEPAIRYAIIPATKDHQVTAALNHYFFGHNVKAEFYVDGKVKGGNLINAAAGLALQFAL